MALDHFVENQVNFEGGKATLIYDGDCPACSIYSKHIEANSKHLELSLVNARNINLQSEEIESFDIDSGIVLNKNGTLYFGYEALYELALLSRRKSIFGTLNFFIFGSKKTAKLLYPFLVFCRKILLKVLQRGSLKSNS